MANAEAKKQDMRHKILQLRKSFKELINKNEQLVPRLKLNKEVNSKTEKFDLILTNFKNNSRIFFLKNL